MEDLLVVGQIINTHGLRGEMKVMPLTEDMRRFDYLEYVILKGKKVKVDGVKYFKDKVILKLEGINSIEEAEKLKRTYLEIEREDAIELEEDEYFIVDLVGCTVVDTEGFEYGKIKDVIQTPSNDVYWVQGKKEVLVPVLKDIVLDINMQFGKTEEDIFRKQMKKIASYYLNTVDDNPNLSIDLINGKMFGLLTESDKGFTMCGAGLTSFCIMPDGNIYPCAYVTNDEAFKIGNIKNGIDIELAQNLPRELFRKEFRDCLECTVKNMCHSMKCGYMNYIKSGFINVPAEIICRQEKLIYPILKDVLYELGKKNILIRQKILGKQVELIERDEKLGELGLKIKNLL